MVVEEIRNIRSERSDLRKFGIVLGIVLGLLGAFLLWRGKYYSYYFLILSAAFICLGLVLPVPLKPIHKIWMSMAIILGWFMSRVILTLLFYLVITPLGLLLRFSGKDFLQLKFDRNASDSYWIPKKKKRFRSRDYERQF